MRTLSTIGLAVVLLLECGVEDLELDFETSPRSITACVGEERTVTYSTDLKGRRDWVAFQMEGSYVDRYGHPSDRVALASPLDPHAPMGEVRLTCAEPGQTRYRLDAYATYDDGERVPGYGSVSLTCVACMDAGVDAGEGAPDGGTSGSGADTFLAPLFADSIGDLVDSLGAPAATSDAVVDQVAGGSEVEPLSQADADHSFNDSTYECGVEEGGMRTVCATAGVLPMPEGELVTIVMDLDAPVPLASGDTSYVFAAVVDSDGDPANDFVPLASYPWDYYQATDRWYELLYDHETGAWSAQVTQLDASGTRTPVASTLRAVIQGERVTFFLARSELSAAVPTYRTTSFRHDGDYTPATRAGDVPLANPTLSLFPLGCGFTGVECGAANGALADCGADHQCVTEASRGACIPAALDGCGGALPPCEDGETCMTEGDAIGSPAYCVPDAARACVCATAAGRHVFPSCP